MEANDYQSHSLRSHYACTQRIEKKELQVGDYVTTVLEKLWIEPILDGVKLTGTQPIDLTAEKLRWLSHIPLNWNGQRPLGLQELTQLKTS